jgi:hypothetical protein
VNGIYHFCSNSMRDVLRLRIYFSEDLLRRTIDKMTQSRDRVKEALVSHDNVYKGIS